MQEESGSLEIGEYIRFSRTVAHRYQYSLRTIYYTVGDGTKDEDSRSLAASLPLELNGKLIGSTVRALPETVSADNCEIELPLCAFFLLKVIKPPEINMGNYQLSLEYDLLSVDFICSLLFLLLIICMFLVHIIVVYSKLSGSCA